MTLLNFLLNLYRKSASSQFCSCFNYSSVFLFFSFIYPGFTCLLTLLCWLSSFPFSFPFLLSTVSLRSDYDDWRPALASLLQPIPFPKEWVFTRTFLSSHSNCICILFIYLVNSRTSNIKWPKLNKTMKAIRERRPSWWPIVMSFYDYVNLQAQIAIVLVLPWNQVPECSVTTAFCMKLQQLHV